jgi:putative intracellular protease/amidase
LLIPGGLGARGPGSEERMKPQVEYLKRLDLSGKGSIKWVLTVCTGSEILARTGILNGRRATTNKRAFNDVRSPSPSFLILAYDKPYISDINRRSNPYTQTSTGSPKPAGSSMAISGPALAFQRVSI